MRDYSFKELNGCYEKGLLERTNKILVDNFNKVAEWIKENCPNLNGKFHCPSNPYYWLSLVVEDGKAYLEYGSHGYSFSLAMSVEETATMATGSCQSIPYAYKGIQFFRNDRLEEFLKYWPTMKQRIIVENNSQRNVFSDDFVA